ncbi:MAG: LLM class flavin-dependent oxidoreductase [Bacteroidetes bacterium]|nr:LLM class flavin-dependent oxidoreductase [Bacteroidota bacterium]
MTSTTIQFGDEERQFLYRTAAVALNGDLVLLQRIGDAKFWCLPGGRMEVGVGRGGVFEAYFWGQDSDVEVNYARYRETLSAVQNGLSHDELTHHGEFYNFDELPMRLRPLQTPYPPFWYMRNVETAAMDGMNTIIVGSLILGIAVDDTIHFMHKFWAYYDKSGVVKDAVFETLRTTGAALLFTSLVLSLGFFVFMQGYMVNMVYFDLLTGLACIFAFLAGEVEQPTFEHLLVAPFHLRKAFYRLIDFEIEQARAGKEAWILAKMNSLEDRKIINRLYEASRAGVRVRLIVRGICCLMPGVPDQSETIEVTSIVDRFLEHARVYVFHHGGEEPLYLASADWMRRNLSRRVEVAFPLYDSDLRRELRTLLDLQRADNTKARLIDADQQNAYVRNGNGQSVRAQIDTYRYFKEKVEREAVQQGASAG